MGKKAVVLSGGGAKGGYQIGVWKVLRQMGFTPDIVVGTSSSAHPSAHSTARSWRSTISMRRSTSGKT